MATRSNTCQLQLPAEYRDSGIHPWFNFDLLKQFVPQPAHLGPAVNVEPPSLDALTNPPPSIGAIVDHVDEGSECYFLVRWVG
eukprot:2527386-Rhodomonas_salina.1